MQPSVRLLISFLPLLTVLSMMLTYVLGVSVHVNAPEAAGCAAIDGFGVLGAEYLWLSRTCWNSRTADRDLFRTTLISIASAATAALFAAVSTTSSWTITMSFACEIVLLATFAFYVNKAYSRSTQPWYFRAVFPPAFLLLAFYLDYFAGHRLAMMVFVSLILMEVLTGCFDLLWSRIARSFQGI